VTEAAEQAVAREGAERPATEGLPAGTRDRGVAVAAEQLSGWAADQLVTAAVMTGD